MKERPHDDRLVLLDLETTGIDAASNRILEVAAMIVSVDLQPIAQAHAVIRPNTSKLEELFPDPSIWEMHEATGLLAEIRNPLRADCRVQSLSEAEGDLIDWLVGHGFGPRTAVLAGNSVHFDRTFIIRWMPDLDRFLHYRMVDVSAMREAYRRWIDPEFPTKWKERWGSAKHRASEDIINSLNELRFFRSAMGVGSWP